MNPTHGHQRPTPISTSAHGRGEGGRARPTLTDDVCIFDLRRSAANRRPELPDLPMSAHPLPRQRVSSSVAVGHRSCGHLSRRFLFLTACRTPHELMRANADDWPQSRRRGDGKLRRIKHAASVRPDKGRPEA